MAMVAGFAAEGAAVVEGGEEDLLHHVVDVVALPAEQAVDEAGDAGLVEHDQFLEGGGVALGQSMRQRRRRRVSAGGRVRFPLGVDQGSASAHVFRRQLSGRDGLDPAGGNNLQRAARLLQVTAWQEVSA